MIATAEKIFGTIIFLWYNKNMNAIDKYKLFKVDRMSENDFKKSLKSTGDINDFMNITSWFASKWGCTAIKLSAMCYYSYVWGLVLLNREIAPFEFQKSDEGPVDKRLAKIYGLNNNVITYGKAPKLDAELEKLLTVIWQKYHIYDGKYLMERAKLHYPFEEAEDTLQAKDMYMFYYWIGKV